MMKIIGQFDQIAFQKLFSSNQNVEFDFDHDQSINYFCRPINVNLLHFLCVCVCVCKGLQNESIWILKDQD